MSTVKTLSKLGLAAIIAISSHSALAAGGAGCGTYTEDDKGTPDIADDVVVTLECSKAPIDFSNKGSLQRGAAMFMNYCLGCHSAQYVRYSRIAKDLDIPPELVEKYLMVTSDQIGDHVTAGIDTEVQGQWFGAAPPDLSLETRLRGDDWVYTYLLTFYEGRAAHGVPTTWYWQTLRCHTFCMTCSSSLVKKNTKRALVIW